MSAEHDSASALVVGSSARIELSASRSHAEQATDTLSDVLREVRLAGCVFFLVDASTPWVAAAPSASTLLPTVLPRAQHLVSYHVIRRGHCWCRMAGHDNVELEAGDVLVVPHGDAYSLCSEPTLTSDWTLDDTLKWFKSMAEGRLPFVVTEGGAGPDRLEVVCGFLGCDRLPFNPVLAGLPRVIRVRLTLEQSDTQLSELIELAVKEARSKRPGGRCVLLRISELMFVELVRLYLAKLPHAQGGWLAALGDPVVGRALALMHERPEAEWTLDSLAKESNSSRSVLAERFTQFLEEPPMQYLTRWRIHLAARLLTEPHAKVASVAYQVGYRSEAAFSRAFKKLLGTSPASWRAARA